MTLNSKLVNKKIGKQFILEFIGNDPVDERVATSFIDSWCCLGIDVTFRIIEKTQYIKRTRSFAFYMLPLSSFLQS